MRGRYEDVKGTDRVSSRTVTLVADEVADLDLTLPKPVTQSVRLIDNDGDPIAGVAIGPWFMQTIGQPFRYGGKRTDAHGRFVLDEFAPGVEAGFNTDAVDGYTSLETPGVKGEPGEVFAEQVVILDRLQGRVSGIVVDNNENPVGDGSFFLRSRYDDGKRATQLVQTEPNGAFSWVVGRPGQGFVLDIANNGGDSRIKWTSKPMEIRPGETVNLGRITASPQ